MEKQFSERCTLIKAGALQYLSEMIGTVDKNVDDVAADLKAHHKDTEAHKGLYLVKEE